jgi:hypothetical protein
MPRKFAGISGSIEGIPNLPDGHFLPPMDLNWVERDVAASIKKQFGKAHDHWAGCQLNKTYPLPYRLPVP